MRAVVFPDSASLAFIFLVAKFSAIVCELSAERKSTSAPTGRLPFTRRCGFLRGPEKKPITNTIARIPKRTADANSITTTPVFLDLLVQTLLKGHPELATNLGKRPCEPEMNESDSRRFRCLQLSYRARGIRRPKPRPLHRTHRLLSALRATGSSQETIRSNPVSSGPTSTRRPTEILGLCEWRHLGSLPRASSISISANSAHPSNGLRASTLRFITFDVTPSRCIQVPKTYMG
jgi:hypothetical protein